MKDAPSKSVSQLEAASNIQFLARMANRFEHDVSSGMTRFSRLLSCEPHATATDEEWDRYFARYDREDAQIRYAYNGIRHVQHAMVVQALPYMTADLLHLAESPSFVARYPDRSQLESGIDSLASVAFSWSHYGAGQVGGAGE